VRLLITGAAGEIGRDVTPLLAARFDVRATDLSLSSPPCEFIQADLLDSEALPAIARGVDAVLHLAALLPRDYTASQFSQVNAAVTTALMAAAAQAGVQHFVYASTVWVTGHGHQETDFPITEDTPPSPVCLYGLTKYLGEVSAEFFARTTPMRVTVLRLCGYQRCPEISADGSVSWTSVDWPTLVFHATRLGQKFFDAVDMADCFEAALRLEARFSRYIVGLEYAFGPEDRELLMTDPAAAWDRRCPGAGAFLRHLGVNPPELPYVYDVSRFRAATGWHSRMNLSTIIRRYLSLYGDRL